MKSFLVLALGVFALGAGQAASLPSNVVFVNPGKFNALIARGKAENWAALPLGERTATVGLALRGTPYKNYTLELDSHTETPCVNMSCMDCWTFFEISLATARALKLYENPTQQDMLHLIEADRYRGGHCNGIFTSRLHYLEQWLADNQSRSLVKDITPSLPGATKIHRDLREMSEDWRSSKQLVANRSLIPVLADIEHQLAKRGIWYVPRSKIPAAEKSLQDGDVICIVTTEPHGYTSHVGLACRDQSGVLRFLHASKTHGKVILDTRLSEYINDHHRDAGIMVGRPADF